MARSVFTREDTFFGVCFALGADFGIDPIWLRVLFAFLFFLSPPAAAGIYAAIGLAVALARWLVPESVDAIEPELEWIEQAEPASEEPQELKLAA